MPASLNSLFNICMRNLVFRIGILFSRLWWGQSNHNDAQIIGGSLLEGEGGEQLSASLRIVNVSRNVIAGFLIAANVPKAVTSQNQEGILVGGEEGCFGGEGVTGDEFLHGSVAQGARHCKCSVDSVVDDEAATFFDALPLFWDARLVIKGESDGSATSAEHSPGIADIGREEFHFVFVVVAVAVVVVGAVGDQDGNNCSAARVNSMRRVELFVNFHKSPIQQLRHPPIRVAFPVLRQNPMQILAAPIGRRLAAVSVVDGKEAVVLLPGKVVHERVSVFHAPATAQVCLLAEAKMESGMQWWGGNVEFPS